MQEVHVFSSERQGVVEIVKSVIKDFKASNELAKRLFKTKLSAQFRTSFLGVFWLILPPVINTVVWVFLNATLNFNIDTGGVPYPVFVFASTTLWVIFTDSLMICKNWYSANISVMSKVDIPKETIIIASFYELFFNTSIKIVVFIVFVAFFKAGQLLFLHYYLMGVCTMLLFGFSVGLLLVPMSMLIADVFSAISVLLPFLMLLSPVMYPLKKDGFTYYLNLFNPIATMIDVPRTLFLGLSPASITSYLVYVGLSMVLLIVGFLFQRVALPHLIVKMS